MKNYIILIISVILIITFGLWELKYFKTTSTYLLTEIDYVDNMIRSENFKEAKIACESFISTWDKYKFMWNIFISHDEIEMVQENVSKLKIYLEKEYLIDSIVHSNLIIENINHIISEGKVSFQTIF